MRTKEAVSNTVSRMRSHSSWEMWVTYGLGRCGHPLICLWALTNALTYRSLESLTRLAAIITMTQAWVSWGVRPLCCSWWNPRGIGIYYSGTHSLTHSLTNYSLTSSLIFLTCTGACRSSWCIRMRRWRSRHHIRTKSDIGKGGWVNNQVNE